MILDEKYMLLTGNVGPILVNTFLIIKIEPLYTHCLFIINILTTFCTI